tara:strand:+ start:586 stop:726 length:141 start_codon:yes stop_codon:yes gene_type:complete
MDQFMMWDAILFFGVVYGYTFGMIGIAVLSHRHQTRDKFGNSGVRL